MSEYERLWYAIGYAGICLAVLVTVRDLALLAYVAARWVVRKALT